MKQILTFFIFLGLTSCFQENRPVLDRKELEELMEKPILESYELFKIENNLKGQFISDSTLLFDFKLGMTSSQCKTHLQKLVKDKKIYLKYQCDAIDSCIITFPIILANFTGEAFYLKPNYDEDSLKCLDFNIIFENSLLAEGIRDSTKANLGQYELSKFQGELVELFTAKFGKPTFKVKSYSKKTDTYNYVWIMNGKEFVLEMESIYDYITDWGFNEKKGYYGVARVEYSDISYQTNYEERKKRADEREKEKVRQQMLSRNRF